MHDHPQVSLGARSFFTGEAGVSLLCLHSPRSTCEMYAEVSNLETRSVHLPNGVNKGQQLDNKVCASKRQMFLLLFLLLGGGRGAEKREETTHNKNKSKQTHLLFPHTFSSSRGLECLLPDKATSFEYKTKNHP